MKYTIKSYSDIKECDNISFTDYGAARIWYNRSMTSDIYKIEMYAEYETGTELLDYREK